MFKARYVICRSRDPLKWPISLWRRVLFMFLRAFGIKIEIVPTGYYHRKTSTALLYVNNIYQKAGADFQLFALASSFFHEYLHHLGLNNRQIEFFTREKWILEIKSTVKRD